MTHYGCERTGKFASAPSEGKEIEMKIPRSWIVAGLLLTGPAAHAQLLPSPGGALGQVGSILDDADRALERTELDRVAPGRLAQRLVAARAARIGDMLRRHGDSVELDDRKEPARRGVILLTGAKPASVDALRGAGYAVESDAVEGIDLPIARITVPPGRSLPRALKQVRSIAPEAEASADNLYFPGGVAPKSEGAALAGAGPVRSQAAGMIDGGVARHASLTGPVEQRGFARGAPRVSSHGTAVASLISGSGAIRGAAPGTPLLVADVYGDDPAGGSAFAIVRALGWMAARGIKVVTVSLVGPDNPLPGRLLGDQCRRRDPAGAGQRRDGGRSGRQ